jgi:hypothetical protein
METPIVSVATTRPPATLTLTQNAVEPTETLPPQPTARSQTEEVKPPDGESLVAVMETPEASPETVPTVTPLEPTAAAPGGAKAIGTAYEVEGVSLSLTDYHIESDGRIGLVFTVANQGKSKVLLRYQNTYFSVSDDTGRTYPQTERNLVDPKQAELEAGASYSMTSNDYPDRHDRIGYFTGMVSEGATYLLVKVSQLAGLRDLLWSIPLNAQAASPQTPVAGSVQQLRDEFSASGISVSLSSLDIESSGQIGLKFIVRNEGNSPVLLRYQNKYFEVKDNLGNTYAQTERNLLDPKQFLLEPGSSYEITSNSYPERYSQIGYFLGMIPEGANQLVVRISQFADLRDMQWTIPLKALLISPQTPSPGSQQPVLEGFSANGISVSLSSLDIESSGQIGLKFIVRNEGNNPVLLRYQNKYFEVKDDLGNTYAQT